MYYILNKDKSVSPTTNLEEFTTNLRENKHVNFTELPEQGLRVSTIFLGTDHSFGGDVPILFETMVFPDGEWGEIDSNRYATYEEALKGHKEMVKQHKEK